MPCTAPCPKAAPVPLIDPLLVYDREFLFLTGNRSLSGHGSELSRARKQAVLTEKNHFQTGVRSRFQFSVGIFSA